MSIDRAADNRPQAIVLGGTHAHQPLLEKLAGRGFRTILADYLPHPIARESADEHCRVSTLDPEAVLALARAVKARLVISTSVDQAGVTACYVAEKLGLPAPYDFATAARLSDKAAMKKALIEAGIPTANHRVAAQPADLKDLGLQWPVVVKPTDSCGSKGVRRVKTPDELRAGFEAALRWSRSGAALIEEFRPGIEISAECFVQDGCCHIVSLYQKSNIYSPRTVIQCFRTLRPAPLSPAAELRLRAILERIPKVFGLRRTSLLVQTMVNGDDVQVIELAARVAGGVGHGATRLFTGFDMIDATIDAYLGEPVRMELQHPFRHCISSNLYGQPGRFGRIEGGEKLKAEGIVNEFYCYKTQGAEIGPEMTSSDRLGAIIVAGDDKEALFNRIEAAWERLQVFDEAGRPMLITDLFRGVREESIYL